jgi:peptide/nickel transport system substrate-binding protein
MSRPLRVLIGAVACGVVAVAAPAAGAPEQTPKRGGTVVIGVPSPEPACLNVLDERCHGGNSLTTVAASVLESPYVVDRDLDARPELVSDVGFTKRPPFTLTYRIRPEARWSDGTPITARDFVFTLGAIRKSNLTEFRLVHRAVRSVRAVDAQTVRVVLRPRYAGWRQLFGFLLPEHALRGEDLRSIWGDSIDNPKTKVAIGSGPFLVERWTRGRELVLRRNSKYWGPRRAYLDRLVVRFLAGPPKERADALRAGSIDIAIGLQQEYATLRGEPNVELAAGPSLGFEHLELRLGQGGHPALKLKAVRRALAFGIDRNALVRQVYGAIVSNPTRLDSAVLPTQSRYYEPSWSEYRRRTMHARRLLEQAGCRVGDDSIYRCNGLRLSLRFMTTAGLPSRQRTLEIVQAQLREIGVDVELVFVPVGALLGPGGILERGEFDVMLFSWVFTLDPSNLVDVFGCGAIQNFTGYCQRLVTADLDQADRILDPRRRAGVLNRAGRQIARDVPMIPLYQFVITSGYSTRMRGYVFNPTDVLWNAEDWWLAEQR